MSRRWTLVSFLLVLGLLIYVGLYLRGNFKTEIDRGTVERGVVTPTNSSLIVTREASDTIFAIDPDNSRRIAGPIDAPVRAILFLDFSNSSSIDMLRTFIKLSEEMDADLSVYLYSFPRYKNELSLPLSALFIESIKKNSLGEFVRWLVKGYPVSKKDTEEFVKKIGADPGVVFAEVKGESITKILAIEDLDLGVNFGVVLPPSCFINGVRIDGNKGYSEIRKIVDEHRSRSLQLINAGKKREDVYREIIKDGRKTAYQIKVSTGDDLEKIRKYPNLYEEDLRYVPYKGPYIAPVTIVMFVDYECPYSKRFFPVIKSAIERYSNDLRVFVKHYPLSTHKRSVEVAKTLASALYQKGFWTMFEKVMEYPEFTDEGRLMTIAAEVGLDVERLKTGREAEEIERYTLRDMEDGARLGVKTLPTIYINGVKYEGVMAPARLFNIIEIEREFANKLLKGGIKPERLYDTLVERNQFKNIVDMDRIIKKPYMEKIR